MAGTGCSLMVVADPREAGLAILLKARARNIFEFKLEQKSPDVSVRYGCEVPIWVERKTLEDFAVSLRDGRHDRMVRTMTQFRSDCKGRCRLIWMIEGNVSPSGRYKRVPYSEMLLAEHELIVVNGIHVMHTRDLIHSADTIISLAQYAPKFVSTEHIEFSGGLSSDTPVSPIIPIAAPRTREELLAKMWAALPNINISFGCVLARSFSALDLIQGRASLCTLRTATGKPASKRALASLIAVRAKNKKHLILLVSGVKGFSRDTARALLTSDKAALVAGDTQALAVCLVGSRPLGATRAAQLGAALRDKIGEPAPAPVPAPAPAPAPASADLDAAASLLDELLG